MLLEINNHAAAPPVSFFAALRCLAGRPRDKGNPLSFGKVVAGIYFCARATGEIFGGTWLFEEMPGFAIFFPDVAAL
jgi:hypothetical protein